MFGTIQDPSGLAVPKAKVEAAPVIEKKPVQKAASAVKKAPAAKKPSQAVGKTVKSTPTNTDSAAVKHLKSLPTKTPRPTGA